MTTLPYGSWPSPITAEMLAVSAVSLSEVRLADGVAHWLEARPSEGGRLVVVKGDPFGATADVTPEGFNARSMAHEYGGGSYTVHRGAVYFSNKDDARLYRQEDDRAPVAITPDTDATHRFADGVVTADGRWWLGVRERHDLGPAVDDVVNELVAVPTDGADEPRVLATGHDFYSSPRISPDGSTLAFLVWDLPFMPWDGCALYTAGLRADATIDEPTIVAGRIGEESIWDPEWSPAGDLVFASDRSGWWNLERIREGQRSVLHAAEAEFGYPQWVFGERSIAFLGDGRIACLYDSAGATHVAVLDPETGELLDLDLPYDSLSLGPTIDAEGSVIVFIAGSAAAPAEVVWLDFSARSVDVLRRSADVPVDAAHISAPEAIEFPTAGDRTAHASYYPPTNPDASGPAATPAPLVVMAHGGPTGNTTRLLNLGTQFWTSRGFGVVDVDYGGSTGYGRAYRQRLNGQWGVVDLQDCVAAADFLIRRGDADPDRLLVRGGSAGGYLVMCALTYTDRFAAGASYFGIADLVPFATGETHKFESRYEHTLVGPWPEAEALYRERSPINVTDRLRTPMLVLQGTEDRVVPLEQAELIVDALRRNGVPYAYKLYEGEGHGFRRAETLVDARLAELSFYAQILGFQPAGDVPVLPLERG
jgi:dipeptidyl aminopeptidase/acylaminoacyl peptidase